MPYSSEAPFAALEVGVGTSVADPPGLVTILGYDTNGAIYVGVVPPGVG
jgi:hypothetical protein